MRIVETRTHTRPHTRRSPRTRSRSRSSSPTSGRTAPSRTRSGRRYLRLPTPPLLTTRPGHNAPQLTNAPTHLTLLSSSAAAACSQVVELETHTQSPETRRRLKHLAHLPLSTPFALAELDCNPLVPAEVMAQFDAEARTDTPRTDIRGHTPLSLASRAFFLLFHPPTSHLPAFPPSLCR